MEHSRMVVKIYFQIIFSSCLTCQAQPARAGMCSGLPPYCATLRLPALGYTFVFPFGHALSRGCSLPVDCATLHPSGCLRQSFSLRSIISPYGLPSAGSVGSHPPGMSHPSGCLYSLPRNRPVAWFPASPRWHVFRFPVSSFCFLPPTLIHFERSLSVRSP